MNQHHFVILQPDLANVVVVGTSYQNKNVRSFVILLLGEGLTFFSINNRTNLLGKKKIYIYIYKMKLSTVFSQNTRKN